MQSAYKIMQKQQYLSGFIDKGGQTLRRPSTLANS